jgi:hypothetical protein
MSHESDPRKIKSRTLAYGLPAAGRRGCATRKNKGVGSGGTEGLATCPSGNIGKFRFHKLKNDRLGCRTDASLA